jgi:hypothetical protein
MDRHFGKDATFLAEVSERAHRVIALAAAECHPLGATDLHEVAWELTGRVLAATPITQRTRSARLMIAGHAAVYLRYFIPPASWRFLGAELELGPGARADGAWESAEGVLVDEVKLAATLARPGGEGPARRQAARYSALAAARWGDRFVGARLVFLGGPRYSLLVGPGDRLRRLVDTPYWFEGTTVSGEVAP